MKVLIPTEPDDKDAMVVKRALEKSGHHVTLMFSFDRYASILDHDYDVVWWRGMRKPSFPCNIAPNGWWINTREAANRANFKLLPLKTASDCGITIPTTLCSHDPEEIRSFQLQHEASGVIYKPINESFVLTGLPGIFQKKIKKKYQLHVSCFGDDLVAAKLNPIEPYVLPEDLTIKIRKTMHELGIVLCTIDFMVTPDDEYIFLDMHEQGPFLWIEEANPEFKMLDIFINFLLERMS